ncbi:Rhodanese-like protein [Annulohypoxylon bovei var. microspora]|nr:Rhodanese-like protein [Annulohypoxylon bovei var. microspora]
MATRRLTATALRGASARATAAAAPSLHVPRASFRTACSPMPRGPATMTPRLLRGVAWYSSSTYSKIWNFEEINNAITPGTDSSPGPEPKVTIIDTREPAELEKTGRIPGALNIPMMSSPDCFHIPAAEFRDRFGFDRPEPDPEDGAQIVFYCKAGVRSRAAAEIARQAGWKNVGEYPGSWIDWVQKGGDIQR